MNDIAQHLDNRAGLVVWDQRWSSEPLMENYPDPMMRGAAIAKHQTDLHISYMADLDAEEQAYWDSI